MIGTGFGCRNIPKTLLAKDPLFGVYACGGWVGGGGSVPCFCLFLRGGGMTFFVSSYIMMGLFGRKLFIESNTDKRTESTTPVTRNMA